MKRLIIGSLLVGAVAAGYFAYPYWTADRLVRALSERDVDTVERLVDWPLLRESVKASVRLSLIGKTSSASGDAGMAAIGGMLGSTLVGQMIDTMVSPEGLRRMFREASEPAPDLQFSNARFVDFDTFRVDLNRADTPTGRFGVKMEFSGLRWRVTGLDIPSHLLAAGLPAASAKSKADRLNVR